MKEDRNILASLGITLAVAGISCMAIVKGLIGLNLQMLSIAVVILSVILLARGQTFRYLYMPTAEVWLIFLYSFVTVIMCLFSGISFMQNGYGFVYQAVYFLEIYLLWNMKRDSDKDLYVEIGFWLCGIFDVIALILLLRSSTGSLFINSYTSADGEYLFNRSTIGTLSFISLSMTLACKARSKWKKVYKTIFIIVALIVVVASSRRSVYLATIVCLLLHFRNCKQVGVSFNVNKLFKHVLGTIAVTIVFFVVYKSSVNVQESLEHAWTMLINGVQTFLGINRSDLSVAMRVTSSSTVINEFLNDSTVMQTVFGRGYMTTWVDIPFIQAFWDLGLFGGIVFFIIQFVIPVKHLIHRADSQGIMAAQYLATLSVFEGLANSFPYGHFFSIILLVTMDDVAEKVACED